MSKEGIKQLRALIRNLKALPSFAADATDKFMKRSAKKLEEMNQENLRNGIDCLGNELRYLKTRLNTPAGTAYSEGYASVRQRFGLQTSFVDLKFMGDFHKSIQLVQLEKNHYGFTSEDEAFPYLVNNYGPNILGVTEQQLNNFAQNDLKPNLEGSITKKIDK